MTRIDHFLDPKMVKKWYFSDPFLTFLARFSQKPAGFGPVLTEMPENAKKRHFLAISANSGQNRPKTGWFLTVLAKTRKNGTNLARGRRGVGGHSPRSDTSGGGANGCPVHPPGGQKPRKRGILSPGGWSGSGFGQAGGLAKTGK